MQDDRFSYERKDNYFNYSSVTHASFEETRWNFIVKNGVPVGGNYAKLY